MVNPAPEDHYANATLALIWTIAWYMCYPIGIVLWYIALAVLFVAKILYQPVWFLAQPFVYFGRFVLACIVFPFTLAAKLETIYIYLGIAAIVGVLGGLLVGAIYGWLQSLLKLNAPSKPKVRSAKEYREQKKQAEDQIRCSIAGVA